MGVDYATLEQYDKLGWICFQNLLVPQEKAGKLRIIAVASQTRTGLMPALPTVAEAGVPGYASVAIFGVLAPAKTPPALIERLNREIVKVLQTADVKERLFNAGSEVVASSADAFGAAGLSGKETAVIYEQSMNSGFGQSCRGYFLLTHFGYPSIKVLHGGLGAWTKAGMPLSTDTPTPTAAACRRRSPRHARASA